MARLKLFAALREAAGVAEVDIEAETVTDLLKQACRLLGPAFSAQLDRATVAVNGAEISRYELNDTTLAPDDEVAFLPPVSGGS